MNQLTPGEFRPDLEDGQRPTAIGCSSWKPTPPSRRNMCCCVHYLGEPEPGAERKIGVYLRRIQGAHGGWPLYHDGAFDISASVKAYFALKMIGDDIDAPHMARAREAILARGGAIKANVFTRILLALLGQTSWRERADRAGRADPAAALVSDPSVQDELLGAHRDRAAAGAAR
jgi:hypothetical protein